MDNNQKTGFTKTGFSKAGFAACSHWQECELGKLRCHYEQIDPEVMEHCFCYQRNHSSKSQNEEIPVIQTQKVEVKETISQLSLF